MKLKFIQSHLFFLFIMFVLSKNFLEFTNPALFFFTSFLSGLILFSVIWATERIFLKKSIALAAGVIILKYAILALILVVFRGRIDDPNAFFWGIMTIVPSVLVFSINMSQKSVLRK